MKHDVLELSICSFRSSVTNVVTCEHDILETNKPIDANYHNRPRSKSTKWSTLGIRRSKIRSHEADNRNPIPRH